jgi:hypothetical protein
MSGGIHESAGLTQSATPLHRKTIEEAGEELDMEYYSDEESVSAEDLAEELTRRIGGEMERRGIKTAMNSEQKRRMGNILAKGVSKCVGAERASERAKRSVRASDACTKKIPVCSEHEDDARGGSRLAQRAQRRRGRLRRKRAAERARVPHTCRTRARFDRPQPHAYSLRFARAGTDAPPA